MTRRTFGVRKQKRKLPETYFRERELQEIRKRHKGKIPFTELVKAGQRRTARYPRKTHRVNQMVIYRGEEYVVRNVSRKGVHLSRLESKNGLIDEVKLGKKIFVPESKYSGRAVPIEPQFFFGAG
jgi:hypothetical protein